MLIIIAVLITAGAASGIDIDGGVIPFGSTWEVTTEPYHVKGDLDIQGLTISAGVEVLFDGNFRFDVNGVLTAVGTAADSISFAADPANVDGWSGINFHQYYPVSEIGFCVIEDAISSGVRVNDCHPIIHDCLIMNNTSDYGGGIRIVLDAPSYSGTVRIEDCVVRDNYASYGGGGIHSKQERGSLELIGCDLIDNQVSTSGAQVSGYAGGLFADAYEGMSTLVDRCTFVDNQVFARRNSSGGSCSARGGGIFFSGVGSAILSASVLEHNRVYASRYWSSSYAYAYGGGLLHRDGTLTTSNCIIRDNYHTTVHHAGGIGAYVESGTASFVNCSVLRNTSSGLNGAGGTVTARNSIFFYNTGDEIEGTVTLEYCDVEDVFYPGTGNVSSVPVLDENDHIQYPSICINTGDPDPVYDDICFPPSVSPLPGDPWEPMYRNDMGYGGGPGACSLVDDPAPPTDLAATSEADRVVLDWTFSDDSGVDRYRIYRGTVSGEESPAVLDSVAADVVTYADDLVDVGTQYYYRLSSVTANDFESGLTAEVCATPGDATAPAAAATPTTDPGDRSITLEWATGDDECDVVAYVIGRARDGLEMATIDTIPALGHLSHSYRDSVENYVEYCYTVRALDNAGLLGAPSVEACDTAEGPRADLRLTKTVDISEPDLGAQVTFTLTVTNDGPDATVNALASDLLPAGLEFVSASLGTYDALSGDWDINVLGLDETVTLDIVATVTTAGETITNTASVADIETTDTDMMNNTDEVALVGSACDLELVKTVDDDDPSVGDEIVFHVVVTNHGPDTATGVEVVDELQPGLHYLRVEKTPGTSFIGDLWDIGTMVVGQVDSLRIFARVDEPGSVCNSASVAAVSPPDLDSENDSDQACMAGRSANLVLAMTASPIGPGVGDPVTILLTILNDGPSSVGDVVVIDMIPAGLINLSITDPPGSSFSVDTWSIDHLAVDESLTLEISATMDTEDPVTNSAHIESSSLSDPNPNNNVAFVTLSTEQIDLWLSKIVDEPSVSVGDTVTFTVALTNDGLVPASNVQVLDSAAPGLTFVSYETTNGTYEVGTGIWSIGSMVAESADSLTVRATVDQAVTVENTATLIGVDQADINHGNNFDSVEVTGMAADIAIIATVSGSFNPRPVVGEVVTLNMLVRNAGPSVAEMVRISALLPSDLALQGTVPDDGSYDYVSGYWDVGTLAAGASKNMALSVEVLSVDPMCFECSVDRSSVPDTWAPNDVSSICFNSDDADLALDKSVSDAAPPVNTNVTYTLRVTNNGPDDVTDVVVTDELPEGVTLVSSTPAGAYVGDVWTVGDLADGMTKTLAIVVTVDVITEITNEAEITGSSGRDDNLDDNTDFVDMTPHDPVPLVTISGEYMIAAGEPVAVSAVAIDNVSVAEVTLHYRAGSATVYTTVTMTPSGVADTWEAEIPAGVAGENGLACFVSARDNAGGEGFSDMVSVSVTVAQVVNPQAQPGGSAQSAYRIISVPLDLVDSRPAAVLEDDFGTYDPQKWRMFGLNASQNWENSEFPNCGNMDVGRGFFLILGEAGRVIDTGAGATVPLDEPFVVNLQAGWNLIGNPFNFDVPMEHVSIVSAGSLNVWDFQGSWGELSGSSNLEPFHGYAVEAQADNDRLLIDPTGTFLKREPVETPDPLWSLNLVASAGESRDGDNTVLVHENAVEGWDLLDRAEPPAIGGYVSLSFPHHDWEGPSHQFAKDARPVDAEGWSWDVEVRTNVAGTVTVDWDGLDAVPEDLQVWLRDELLMINMDLRETENYTFVGAHESQTQRQLLLVIGSEDYIAAELPESESIPAVLTLKANFPNPFNPATTIRYGVPREGRVELGVYDMRGRLISRLVDEVKPAGYHAVIWEGTDSSDQRVARGVYLYRVVSDGESRNQKMLLVK